jgi:hypothetical protein
MGASFKILIAGAMAVWLSACEEERVQAPAGGGVAERDVPPQEQRYGPQGAAATPGRRQLDDRAYRVQGDP